MKSELLKPTSVYDQASERLEALKMRQTILTDRIRKALPGKIHIVTSGNTIYYYHRKCPSDKSGHYLAKKDSPKIRNLLQKCYDEKALKEVEEEIKYLEKLLVHLQGKPERIRGVFETFPEKARHMITPIDMSDEVFAKAWLSLPYDKKANMIDGPEYLTEKGDRVRSKSELNIANELYRRGIPYKYECALRLKGGLVIYPDFTVLDTKRRRVVYWEHRGMMDDRGYAKYAVQRLTDYQANRIFLGDNLIITEETSDTPLGTNTIRTIIAHYFER